MRDVELQPHQRQQADGAVAVGDGVVAALRGGGRRDR